MQKGEEPVDSRVWIRPRKCWGLLFLGEPPGHGGLGEAGTQGSADFLEAEGLGVRGGKWEVRGGSGPQAQALPHITRSRRRRVLTNVGKLDPSVRTLLEGNAE